MILTASEGETKEEELAVQRWPEADHCALLQMCSVLEGEYNPKHKDKQFLARRSWDPIHRLIKSFWCYMEK